MNNHYVTNSIECSFNDQELEMLQNALSTSEKPMIHWNRIVDIFFELFRNQKSVQDGMKIHFDSINNKDPLSVVDGARDKRYMETLIIDAINQLHVVSQGNKISLIRKHRRSFYQTKELFIAVLISFYEIQPENNDVLDAYEFNQSHPSVIKTDKSLATELFDYFVKFNTDKRGKKISYHDNKVVDVLGHWKNLNALQVFLQSTRGFGRGSEKYLKILSKLIENFNIKYTTSEDEFDYLINNFICCIFRSLHSVLLQLSCYPRYFILNCLRNHKDEDSSLDSFFQNHSNVYVNHCNSESTTTSEASEFEITILRKRKHSEVLNRVIFQ